MHIYIICCVYIFKNFNTNKIIRCFIIPCHNRTQFKKRVIKVGSVHRTLKLTHQQQCYNDAIGFLRAGNEHANAFVKRFEILGGKYRGRVFTLTGFETLKAAAQFCCNARAAHFFVFPQSARDLSRFADLPVMDRAGIGARAQLIYDAAKLHLREVIAQRPRGGRGPRARAARPAVPRGHYGLGAIDAAENSDLDASASDSQSDSDDDDSVSSLESADDFVAHADALVVARGRQARRHQAAPDPDPVRPVLDALYVWNGRGGRWDVRITAINDVDKTATFVYLPPHQRHGADSRPWAQLEPAGVALLGRGRRH